MIQLLFILFSIPVFATGSFEQKTGRPWETSYERVREMEKPQSRVIDGKKTLVLVGDARIAVWGIPGDFGGYKVYNMGNDGLTMYGWNRTVLPFVSAGIYDTAIVSAGLVDIMEYARPDELSNNIYQAVSTMRCNSLNVILLSCPGVTVSTMYNRVSVDAVNERVVEYNKTLAAVAKRHGIPLLKIDKLYEKSGELKEKYAGQLGFIYNEAGYKVLYEIISDYLKEKK